MGTLLKGISTIGDACKRRSTCGLQCANRRHRQQAIVNTDSLISYLVRCIQITALLMISNHNQVCVLDHKCKLWQKSGIVNCNREVGATNARDMWERKRDGHVLGHKASVRCGKRQYKMCRHWI